MRNSNRRDLCVVLVGEIVIVVDLVSKKLEQKELLRYRNLCVVDLVDERFKRKKLVRCRELVRL